MSTLRLRSCLKLWLLLLQLVAPICWSGCSDPKSCWQQQGASVAPLMNEPGSAKFVLDGTTTLEGPLEFGTGDFISDRCTVETSVLESHDVDSSTATSIPTWISVACDKTSDYPKYFVEVSLFIPDMRDLGPGSYDLKTKGGEVHYAGFAYPNESVIGSHECLSSPPREYKNCAVLTAKTVTVELVIDEALGTKELPPKNVSADFRRTAHLQFNLNAAGHGASVIVAITLPFTQTAAEYVGADTVTRGCIVL